MSPAGERDFSLSGRVFGPLRESMATGVGEQMVSIPLIAVATPVTVDQVLRQYIANNAKAKLAKAPKAAAAATDAVSSSSDSDSHSDSDSEKSGYDPEESPTETKRRLARGPHRGHSGPLKPTTSEDSDGSDSSRSAGGKGKGKGNGTSSKSAGGKGKGNGTSSKSAGGSKLEFDLIITWMRMTTMSKTTMSMTTVITKTMTRTTKNSKTAGVNVVVTIRCSQ